MINTAFLWFFAWPHWAEYLLVGWLVFGLSVYLRDVTEANWKATLVTCLTTWPIALALQVLAGLYWLALRVFHPDTGPLALWFVALRRALHSRARAGQRAIITTGAASLNEVRAAKQAPSTRTGT